MEIKLDNVCLSEIQEFIDDDDITDINWNGRELWISNLKKGNYKSDKILSERFVRDVSNRFSNLVRTHFNQENPLLEAETDDLRVSIYHDSVLSGGSSLTFRKVPLERRLTREKIISTKYCPEKICNFMENAIKSHCNIVIGGMPGAGKTEYLKFLTEYIPAHERAITIEDSYEIHYSVINPGKDCVEIRVNKNLSYEKAISGSLRHNAKWTLLSEARGKEVLELMKGISDGCHILTTIHTDDAKSIPDRMLSMAGELSSERFINILYNHIDIGVIIEADANENSITRRLAQIVIFSREYNHDTNKYENYAREFYNADSTTNKVNLDALSGVIHMFKRAGCENVFER